MHYYQFNVGDYKSHTAHLELLEDIAYRRLLDLYYQSEKPIPLDIQEVARLICMRSNYECITVVLREFFIETGCGFVNKRADKEIAAYHAKSDKAKASIAARWNKPKQNQSVKSDTNVLQSNNERNTKHKTLNIKQEPLNSSKASPSGSRLDADFNLPDEWVLFCQKERPELNPLSTFLGFKDYWIAQAGSKGRKADWFATWRNWVRNQKSAQGQYLTAQEKASKRNAEIFDYDKQMSNF